MLVSTVTQLPMMSPQSSSFSAAMSLRSDQLHFWEQCGKLVTTWQGTLSRVRSFELTSDAAHTLMVRSLQMHNRSFSQLLIRYTHIQRIVSRDLETVHALHVSVFRLYLGTS